MSESKGFCRKCGTEIKEGDAFCSKCGTNLTSDKSGSSSNRWNVADQNITGAFQLAFKSMIYIDVLILSYQALTHQPIDSQSTLLYGALGGIVVAAVNYIVFVNKKELENK